MEMIQLGVEEQVLRKFGEDKIKDYVNKMISIKKMELFTNLFHKTNKIPENTYFEKLDENRNESWKEYKKDLNL